MRLLELLDTYALSRPIKPSSLDQLRITARGFERWITRAVDTTDLTDDLVNRWLLALEASGKSRTTIKGQRANLLTIWRAAVEDGHATTPPRRIKRIKAPPPMPEAWNLIQMKSLLTATESVEGYWKWCGIERRAWWRAWCLIAYDSGMRPCDMLTLNFEHVGTNGVLIKIQEKTGQPLFRRFREETVAAMDAIANPARKLVFPWAIRRCRLYYYWKEITVVAGLVGGPAKIRKTGATLCEIERPGSAAIYLGHTSGVAYKHYVDMRQLAEHAPLPPRIA